MASPFSYATKSGKRWAVPYTPPGRGQTTKRGFLRERDAKAWSVELESSKLHGQFVAPTGGRITVGEVFEQWFSGSARIKATTRAARESAWNHRVGPRWKSTPVGDVRTSAVEFWVADLAAEGIGAASIEAALLVLRNSIQVAVKDRKLGSNPAAGVKAPRRTLRRRGYLTLAQLERIADEVGKHRDQDRVAVWFLGLTGLRWGEMAALTVGSFDMLRRRVQVTQALAEVKGKATLSTPKTHERRSVPFPADLADDLAALMVGKTRDDLVFTGPKGGFFLVSTFRPRVFAGAVERCQEADSNFPTITPHDLRHTAVSLAISLTHANVKAVQTMVGHASAAMTLDTYADLFPDDLDSVAEGLDDAIRTHRKLAPVVTAAFGSQDLVTE